MSTPECNPGCLPRPGDYSRVSVEFVLIVAGVAYSTGKLPPWGILLQFREPNGYRGLKTRS